MSGIGMRVMQSSLKSLELMLWCIVYLGFDWLLLIGMSPNVPNSLDIFIFCTLGHH